MRKWPIVAAVIIFGGLVVFAIKTLRCQSRQPSDAMLTDGQLLDRREIVLRGTIDDKLVRDVIAKMLYLQHLDPNAAITLHIDSPGGSVTSGLAVCDTMDQIRPPVITICHGDAHGMAAMIAAHGKKGSRFAAPTTRMSLSLPYVADGVSVDQNEISRTLSVLVAILSKDTGMTTDETKKHIQSGLLINVARAKSLGLIDGISAKDVDPFRN